MLWESGRLLRSAHRGRYAIGAFNVVSLETCQAVIQAAERVEAPAILMIWEDGSLIPHEIWMPVLRHLANVSSVPIAITLDHGMSEEIVKQAIQIGCTGVMYDGSSQPMEENARITAELTKIAHSAGIGIEAEIGHVGDASDMSTCELTEPSDAASFVQQTGVDALAVAIGTAHGIYCSKPQLDFDRLTAIQRLVDIPLVLHGGSGTPRDDLVRSIHMGIAKINVYTDLVQRAREPLLQSLEERHDLIGWLRAVNSGISDMAAEYLELFGAAGHARDF